MLEFQNNILPHVSRTFALSIPMLPYELRDIIANAYLLCRIADTVEDDPKLTPETKLYFSNFFNNILENNLSASEFSKELSQKLDKSCPEKELELILNTEKIIAVTKSFSTAQQKILHKCIKKMCKGMPEFSFKQNNNGIENLKDLDLYCYYVAGIVGEMLTELFADYNPKINNNINKLLKLSISFGQGLQMTNIIKDIWDDQKRKISWIPKDILKKHDNNMKKVINELINIADGHLKNAIEYTLLIPRTEYKIRKFCLLAISLAFKTLNKLKTSNEFLTGQNVKITRKDVKKTLVFINLFSSSNFAIKNFLS